MHLRLLSLILFPLVVCADQVVLTNGDIITGIIEKKDGDKLTIKSEFLGQVSMPWSAVKSLKSDSDLTVVLPGGEAVHGKVSTAGDSLEVVTPAGTQSAPLSGVSAVRNPAEQHSWERLQHPGLLELWTANVDLGLALARGNARTDTLTTAITASRVTRQDKITTYFNQIRGSARVGGVNTSIASAVRGGWTYNRDLSPRIFVSTLNDYEHDRFQNLDLRFAAGAGFGWNVVKTEAHQFSLLAGADYSRENFLDNVRRNSAEANFGDDFHWRVASATSVTQSFRMFSNLSNTGEYRVNFDLGWVTAIKKWLGWHVTASDRFLSNPVAGRQRNDLLISTGFRLSFAR